MIRSLIWESGIEGCEVEIEIEIEIGESRIGGSEIWGSGNEEVFEM